jgi:hypothetical protein
MFLTDNYERPDPKDQGLSADEEHIRHDFVPGHAGTGREVPVAGEDLAESATTVQTGPQGWDAPGAAGVEKLSANGGSGPGGDDPLGFLELVYGVLFEPRTTMARIAARPPVASALLIVTILGLVGTTMTVLALGPILSGEENPYGFRLFSPGPAAWSFIAFFALLWGYVKWFSYSAVLHLVAELLGGRGTARAVFAAVGLSGLPALFLVPFQFLAVFFFARSAVFEILLVLAGLGVMIWSFVLVVTALGKVHQLSAGRALLTALTPFLALLAIGLAFLVTLAVYLAAMPSKIQVPGF